MSATTKCNKTVTGGVSLLFTHRAEKLVVTICRKMHRGDVNSFFQRITEKRGTHKYCIVYENELERVWPALREEAIRRSAAIQTFAKAHGFSATIHDPGLRVTFRKLNPTNS